MSAYLKAVRATDLKQRFFNNLTTSAEYKMIPAGRLVLLSFSPEPIAQIGNNNGLVRRSGPTGGLAVNFSYTFLGQSLIAERYEIS